MGERELRAIGYAVIGCGGRISGLLKHLKNKEGIELKGGWDPSEANVRDMLNLRNEGRGRIYQNYEEVLGDRDVQWILVGSPNIFHKEHIVAAFLAGKHVFAEKPLATTINECLDIRRIHRGSGRLFATGFTLRYATIYRKSKEILESGKLGRIISINACENILPGHGSYIMKNWRRKRELSGPHILEKCVHDLDLLNWFTGSVPVKVAAFGGNNMFIPENSKIYESGREAFDNWKKGSLSEKYDEDERNPFLTSKTIEDNVVSIMEFANGIRVQFQATMSNSIPERRMYFHCSAGNLIIELYSGVLQYKAIDDESETFLNFTGGGHGDGDENIMSELYESMIHGCDPRCSGDEGLLSAVSALSIDRAREESRIIDLVPIWRELDVSI